MSVLLPSRNPSSHKGENGKVLVIGGNKYCHGAPILSAMGAEKTGIDLLFVAIPSLHQIPARTNLLNAFVLPFRGDFLSKADLPLLLEYSQKVDTVLLGNGIGKERETQETLLEFLCAVQKPIVLDAEALFPEILQIRHANTWIITPHEGEFERLFGEQGNAQSVQKMAKQHGITILTKGAEDLIADGNGNFAINTTGCAEMSVGGTGDTLAGIVAGFVARGLFPFDAVHSAVFYWGKCGEQMKKSRWSFSARQMLEELSSVFKNNEENKKTIFA
jgi:hydroxyethylthiazole kinase-like uncharacterized protein yjeF